MPLLVVWEHLETQGPRRFVVPVSACPSLSPPRPCALSISCWAHLLAFLLWLNSLSFRNLTPLTAPKALRTYLGQGLLASCPPTKPWRAGPVCFISVSLGPMQWLAGKRAVNECWSAEWMSDGWANPCPLPLCTLGQWGQVNIFASIP